jgi:hypothetical protein
MWGIKSASTDMDMRCIHNSLKDTLLDYLSICENRDDILADVYSLLNGDSYIKFPYVGDVSQYDCLIAYLNSSENPEENWAIFIDGLMEDWANLIELDWGAYEDGYHFEEDAVLVEF